MNHTPESLLALTKSPEGLEQLLRIGLHYAEWTDVRFTGGLIQPRQLTACIPQDSQRLPAPKLTTSLDAIFAAEERLGLHGVIGMLPAMWQAYALYVLRLNDPSIDNFDAHEFAFLTPPLRLIPFILTAQWKEQNL